MVKMIKKVSVHGGHSKEFCFHAKDLLEDIIEKYIEEKFAWIGITEHCPPLKESLRYPDEIDADISKNQMEEQFKEYILKVNKLKEKYRSKIKIFTAFETESYDGYIDYTKNLIKSYEPDYIAGSVHHINNICFDFSKQMYGKAIKICGSINALYEKYYDKQYEMITHLKPAVIAHFDLIRIFDKDYQTRIQEKKIWEKIIRNLKICKEYGLILDYNTRAIKKGAKEPYISSAILDAARKLNVKVVPGDDSHSIIDIGTDIKQSIKTLSEKGFNTDWSEPEIYKYS